MTSTAIDQITIPSTPVQQPDPMQQFVPIGAETSELVLWAYEARQARAIAVSLAKTSFVPLSLRGKPDDITAAILAGQELGMKPMATLRSIDVIQGTPALRAHAQRALLQSHGHKVKLVESTNEKCVMRGRRADETDADWQTIEWDLKRAEGLGLLGKAEWKKQPKTMLVARATGEICRLVASDVLHAMPYNAEELRDSEDEAEPVARARVTIAEIQAQQKRPVVDPEGGSGEITDAVVVEETTSDGLPSRAAIEIDKVETLFKQTDFDDEKKAEYIAEKTGREVPLTDLSYVELARLGHALEGYIAQSEPPATAS
jgi:hypothetical protein